MDKFREKYFRITAFMIKSAGLWPHKKKISSRVIQILVFFYMIVYVEFSWVSIKRNHHIYFVEIYSARQNIFDICFKVLKTLM